MSRLQMTVNGRAVSLDIPESRFLSEVIREDLGLTGTKIGCNEAECGICTVLVNGTPVVSCTYPAFKAQGASVETIEGLSTGLKLHPLQQAFLDHGAVALEEHIDAEMRLVQLLRLRTVVGGKENVLFPPRFAIEAMDRHFPGVVGLVECRLPMHDHVTGYRHRSFG